ncbi:MAG: hypothetical protein JNN20_00450 [Betaproteobacteria bacterium]|nr:hypothetical protein [Betaproteobacteria bacterium]
MSHENHEVHLFSAQATVVPPAGKESSNTRHALLVFVRQPIGTDFDWQDAGRIIGDGGWDDIVITKAAKAMLMPPSSDNTLRDAYLSAMENGSSLVIYAQAT